MTSKEAMKRIAGIKQLKESYDYGEWSKITALDSKCKWVKVINCMGWFVSVTEYEWQPDIEMYLSKGHTVVA